MPTIDLFDREAVFIERVLQPLRRDFPGLKIVFEHITTTRGGAVRGRGRPASGGDDHRAPPAVQPQRHLPGRPAPALLLPAGAQARGTPRARWSRRRLRAAPKFFLGTDSAPHAAALKEHAAACAGCYTALAALELYAEAFEAAGALDRLEGFASFHGADFYGLPRNRGRVTLRANALGAARKPALRRAQLKPLCGGETLNWKMIDEAAA